MATLNIKKSRHGREYYELNYSEGGKQNRRNIGYVSGRKSITPHDAKIALNAKTLELDTGKKIFTGETSFDDLVQRYLTWHAVEFPASSWRIALIVRDAIMGQLDNKGRPFFQGKTCGKITAELTERWKAARQCAKARVRAPKSPTGWRETNRTLSATTVAKEVRTLKALINKGVEWGDFDKHVIHKVKPPVNLTSRKTRYYTSAQLKQLFERPLHGNHWKFIGNCGARRGEAMHLLHRHVDVAKKVIVFESEPTARLKSAKYREVPMTEGCLQAYAAIYKAARLAFRELNGRLPTRDDLAETPVLPKMAAPSWSRAFRRDRDALGLPKIKGSLVHLLRHCYGGHAIEEGLDIRTVQLLLGHANVTTTEQYTNPGREHLHQEGRRIRL